MLLHRRWIPVPFFLALTSAQTTAVYQVGDPQTVMVAMRDGVHLATDIYRPMRNGALAEGKFPVVLERTPYNKNASRSSARFLVPRGYIFVAQDVRGRYGSEGHWFPIRDDPKDGFDTAKWLGDQPWFDGNLGTLGSSYPGATQHALAIGGAPYLKAMVPRNAMSDVGHYGVRHNGAFELRWFNWVFMLGNPNGTANLVSPAALRAAADPVAAPALVDMGKRVNEYVRSLPLRPGTTPLKFAPDYETWLIEGAGNPTGAAGLTVGHGAVDGAAVTAGLIAPFVRPAPLARAWYCSDGEGMSSGPR